MATTISDLINLAVIGIYNDLENDKNAQYFLVGSIFYQAVYTFLKYEVIVVYWGFFEDAVLDGW